MKFLFACMAPSLQSRLANLGVHTDEITTLHSPKYITPTLPSPRQSQINVALDPLPALCPLSPHHQSSSLDHGVHWTNIFSPLLLPPSLGLLCGSKLESSTSDPSLPLPPHSQCFGSYQSIFVKANIPKKA